MREIWKKLIFLSFVLIFTSIACTSIYFFGIDEDYCEAMGGRWNPWTQDCIEPLSGNSASEESKSEPAEENASEPVDEIVSDPAGENDSEPLYEISIEDCVAKPGEYTWEFANMNNEGSNDTKKVCQGDFNLQNTSKRVLHFKWFEYWDNGAMQDIGWEALCQRLEPGETFSQYFGTQTFSTGNISETVATYPKLIVFYDLPDCVGFLLDTENETLWDEFAIPLSDPCR